MAIICLASFPKRTTNLLFLRLLKQTYSEQKLMGASSPKSITGATKSAPIKFTTNVASTVPIAETTGLSQKEVGTTRFTGHVVFMSIFALLLYFCFIREENDIDEILKGNYVNESNQINILNLKLQLLYCEKNKLPTAAIKAKIMELEQKERLSKE